MLHLMLVIIVIVTAPFWLPPLLASAVALGCLVATVGLMALMLMGGYHLIVGAQPSPVPAPVPAAVAAPAPVPAPVAIPCRHHQFFCG